MIRTVKLSLCLTKYHAMETYGGATVQIYTFLTAALDGDHWSASRPCRFTPSNLSDRRLDGPQSRSGYSDCRNTYTHTQSRTNSTCLVNHKQNTHRLTSFLMCTIVSVAELPAIVLSSSYSCLPTDVTPKSYTSQQDVTPLLPHSSVCSGIEMNQNQSSCKTEQHPLPSPFQ